MLSRRIALALAAVFTCAPALHAQARLTGSWQGHWIRAGDTLPVTLAIRRDTATGGFAATFSSDRLRVSGIPFNEVRLEGCCDVTMVLRGDRTTAVFTGRFEGDSLSGTLGEETGDGRFAYVRVRSPPPTLEERDVTFPGAAGTLAGTLILPRSGNALAAVVFLHGSGAEGRWASRYLAGKVAGRGIAALIFDKRGVGKSTGDWRTATPDDLAADAIAAVARLKSESRVDPRRIGIHGHSQGGTLAPLVAAQVPGVAFVVGSAAAGTPMDSTELYSVLNSLYPEATSAADSADARAYVGELVSVAFHGRSRVPMDSLAAALRGRPWFFEPPPPSSSYWAFSAVFGNYRPLEWWRRVRVPVLLVYGAGDQRVPAAESARRIEAALRQAGNGDVTVHIFPGADHTFRLPAGPGGWPVTVPGYPDVLLDWLGQFAAP